MSSANTPPKRLHFGADGRRQRRRDARFQFTRAALDFFNAFRCEKLFRGIVGQLQRVESLRFGGEIARVDAEPGELFVVFRRETELQPPPAPFFEANVATARVKQQFQFLRREPGVADLEHDFEIEPVNARFGDVERDVAADRRVAQRGQFLVQQHFNFRRERLEPTEEQFRSFFDEPQRPLAGVILPFQFQRFDRARKIFLRGAVVDDDDAIGRLGISSSPGCHFHFPASRCESFRFHSGRFGGDAQDDVLDLAAGRNRS